MKLTKSELEIMQVLWKAGRSLTRGEILSLSAEKSWKDSSIHILLNGMLKKQAIREDGFARSGKVWARLYAPCVTMERYYGESVFAESSPAAVPQLFSALLDRRDLTPELIAELRGMLDKREQELDKP